MHRRVIGSAVVLLAVAAALVLPNIDGRRAAGSASREPIPPPPRVGDCLTERTGVERSALMFSGAPVLHATTAACGDQNYGEVVWIAADSDDFPMTRAGGLSYPEPQACREPAEEYVQLLGYGSPDWGPWRPYAASRVGVIGPDIWQYLTGQRWLACVVYPDDAPYLGSIRGSAGGPASPVAASAFSMCQVWGDTPEPIEVQCAEPHSTEALGVTGRAGEDEVALAEGCQALMSGLSGLADPTAGGELDIVIAPVTPAAGQPADRGQRRICLVETTSGRSLIASLLGRGEQPLPLGG